jgi:hypothetical protein
MTVEKPEYWSQKRWPFRSNGLLKKQNYMETAHGSDQIQDLQNIY